MEQHEPTRGVGLGVEGCAVGISRSSFPTPLLNECDKPIQDLMSGVQYECDNVREAYNV